MANKLKVAQVKAASVAHVQAFAAVEEPTPEAVETATDAPASDPTVVHAGLTELEATETSSPMANGHNEPIPNASISDDAANAAAESQWDNTNDMSASQEDWVKVPRDPLETDTGLTATPAASGPVQSWADDQPENPPEVCVPLIV